MRESQTWGNTYYGNTRVINALDGICSFSEPSWAHKMMALTHLGVTAEVLGAVAKCQRSNHMPAMCSAVTYTSVGTSPNSCLPGRELAAAAFPMLENATAVQAEMAHV